MRSTTEPTSMRSGSLAYQVLTGELPFFGDSVMEVMVKQTAAERPAASAACPDVPPQLDEPLQRMMAKDPAARPAGILEAVDALAEAAQVAGISTSGGTLSRRSGPGGVMPTRPPQSSAAPSPSTGGQRSPGTSSGARPASSTAGLETSDTIADPALRVAPPRGGPLRTIGVVAGLGVLLAGAFLAQRKLAADAATSPPPRESSAPVAPADSVPAPLPSAEVPPPSPPASASASPQPDVVVLRVEATPADAEVWAFDRKLGAAKDELTLPRSDTPVKVQIKRSGFVTVTREVVPNVPLRVEATLVAVPNKQYAF